MTDPGARWHAHVYYDPAERQPALALRDAFRRDPAVLFIGAMADGPVGPHPVAQFEAHFHDVHRAAIVDMIKATGLRALIHPLTDDDLADHTSLAHWIGEPIALNLSVLDPPGVNQGIPRFGVSDF